MGIKAVRFRGRRISRLAVFFLITGIIALCVPIVLPILSANGIVLAEFGLIGVVAAILAVAGIIAGAYSARERDIVPTQPYACMIVNGTALIVLIVIYLVGLV